MINTNYWYYGNIRHMILCVLRLFQNFCISQGIDENGNQILKRVPVTFMSTDKSVVYMLNNNTDTVLQTVPKMVLALSNVKLNNEKISGAPYYPDETAFTEKKFNPDSGNYEYKPGNSYNITRLNPLPIGLEFKLFVLTTMLDQKLQLFEQIRSIFSPTLEIQTSENPIDWSRVTSIALTGLNWSSKGTSNLDSTTLDSMDMTFEIDMNLDMPTIVEKQSLIEQIAEAINDDNSFDDIMGWDLSDKTVLYHSPTKNKVKIMLDEKSGKEKIHLIPSDIAKTWYDIFKIYGFNYNPSNQNILISCSSESNDNKKINVCGSIVVDRNNPTIACYHINDDFLPETNIKPIDEIIDPHNFTPSTEIGTRYLLMDEISNCELWGTFLNEEKIPLTEKEKVEEGSIIELSKDGWFVAFNPKTQRGIWFLRDNSSPQNLYTYNNMYELWTDAINKTYNVGYWRIGEKPFGK